MNAASVNAAPALPTLPAEFAAALDATGRVRARHPVTGEAVALIRAPAAGSPGGDAPAAGHDDGRTDAEAILAGLADADAGRTVPLAGLRAEMERRHPELRGR